MENIVIDSQSLIFNNNQPINLHSIDPLSDAISSVQLIRVSGSDLDIVNAARVSYGKISEKFSEKDYALIKFLIEHNHTSPFEHNQLSFRVKAPIFITRQWMRHRMNSYNEISYRYVTAPVEFYIPHEWRFQDNNNKQSSQGAFENSEMMMIYKNSIAQSYDAYVKLLANGISREQARAVLPVATYTEFIFTCNLHSLMHFLQLRLSAGAQNEIRLYAHALYVLASKFFPVTLSEWMSIKKKNIKVENNVIDLWKKQLCE